MERNNPLLPFAFTTSSINDKSPLNTDPREKHVIDENASSMYHTRGALLTRKKAPFMMPTLKRKMGASFNENDDVKRRDYDPFADPNDQVDTDADEMISSIAIPSSPPVLPQMSEYDMSTSNYTMPDSPVETQYMLETLKTSPVKRPLRPQHSLEADFGIDQFNRFKTSSYIQCPSTDDLDCDQTNQYSRARAIILEAFEDINPSVNLENMGLTEIPEEIKDLDNLVIFDLDMPTQTLYQLYLNNNKLRSVNPALFKFSKLNVLSLRHNHIHTIPAAIGHLTSLVDLNIGANRLRVLPAQILNLPRLINFRAGPNPFIAVAADAFTVDDGNFGGRQLKFISPIHYLQDVSRSVPALKTLCLDTIARYDVTYRETRSWKKYTPKIFHHLIARAISKGKFENMCNECDTIVVEPHAEVYEWWDILQNKNVPIKREFCSGKCARLYEVRNTRWYKREEPI